MTEFKIKEIALKNHRENKIMFTYCDNVDARDKNSIKNFQIWCKPNEYNFYWCEFEKLDHFKNFFNFIKSKKDGCWMSEGEVIEKNKFEITDDDYILLKDEFSSLDKYGQCLVYWNFINGEFNLSIKHAPPPDTPPFLFSKFDKENFNKIESFIDKVLVDWEKIGY